jgi:5-(carboxyamino)imidazole ribonucleotide mutase
VATVALDGAKNAAILAAQILSLADNNTAEKIEKFKTDLANKITKANFDLANIKFEYKTN